MSNDNISRLINNFYKTETVEPDLTINRINEAYFRTVLFQSKSASKRYKTKKISYEEMQKQKFEKTENSKLEFIKDNLTNDDFLNSLTYDDKLKLLDLVKERLGFIYYPGCRDIYEIKEYDKALEYCENIYQIAKDDFISQKESTSVKTRVKNKHIFK